MYQNRNGSSGVFFCGESGGNVWKVWREVEKAIELS